MGRSSMNIGVLTSSRADFGIYLPLLNALSNDPFFQLEVIAFGTHLSAEHGFTLHEIKNSFKGTIHEVPTLVSDKDAHAVARSYSNVVSAFSELWGRQKYDLVLCLGDRYEMNAAVNAGIPYGVKFAHFHGGEKTLGAFDNIYRHQITLASSFHFTATEEFAARVNELLDAEKKYVFSVGSLSLSDLESLSLRSREELNELYSLPKKPFILCTFHPETADPANNPAYAEEMVKALESIPESQHLVISLPNADTNGNIYRNKLNILKEQKPDRYTLVENFGKTNYFSAMQHCSFLLGNSSSGIIEAASFGKYVIDVGERQKGRLTSGNVFHVPFEHEAIGEMVTQMIDRNETFSGQNKYVRPDTVSKTVEILRSIGNGEI